MKIKIWERFIRYTFYTLSLFVGFFGTVSCEDEYLLDNKEPDFLGGSIYDYLNEQGNYTYFVQIIEDVGYKEVLQKTGSKTLFVANDSAFERFFQNNPWGVSSFSELSKAQKTLMLNFSMINNAYLIETLSSYWFAANDGLMDGQSMRKSTAVSMFDSVPFEKGDQLPNGPFWNYYKTAGIHLLKDQTSSPMVYFVPKQLEYAQIFDEDFEIMTGTTRTANDAHIFDDKIIERDIVCKNGYVNVLENVLMPKKNMAEFIQTNPYNSMYSSMLHRYCAPYYIKNVDQEYKKTHINFSDSIFVKKFYTVNGHGGMINYPNGRQINEKLLLPFDPGWNSYNYFTPVLFHPMENDMGAMFAPTNEALDNYFNNGNGRILKERYGSWDNVPDDILILFLKRHMRGSYLESIPSRFGDMNDDENFPIPANKSDVVDSYIGVNGLVYVINTVYPPPDYESVYSPVLFSSKTKVFEWAVTSNDFRLYLNAMSKGIKYSFFVPTDQYLTKYIDPITLGKNIQGALKYWYNDKSFAVNATLYKYNPLTQELGDSIGVITRSAFISNRLLDLLDNHIVIGEIVPGKQYYLTKGGNILKVTGSGTNMKIEGGGDLELGQQSGVNEVFTLSNGVTYFIDKPIQTPFRSVYTILSTTSEFSEFFNLLKDFKGPPHEIFGTKPSSILGIDYNINFFKTYNYTIYVPTNAAIQDAISSGIIIPWVSQNGITGINDMVTNSIEQTTAILKLERFIRYHFQDSSILIGGEAVSGKFSTATIKEDNAITAFRTYKNKYYKIGVTSDGSNLSLATEKYGTANIITQPGLYNIQTRDYVFSAPRGTFKEIDGSGTGTDYSNSQILTSSTAVIHQIDKVLQFE